MRSILLWTPPSLLTDPMLRLLVLPLALFLPLSAPVTGVAKGLDEDRAQPDDPQQGEELEAAYEDLVAKLEVQLEDWRKRVAKSSAIRRRYYFQRIRPERHYYTRFAELADRGSRKALWWMLQNQKQAGFPVGAGNANKAKLYVRLMENFTPADLELDWFTDALVQLEEDVHVFLPGQFESVYTKLIAITKNPDQLVDRKLRLAIALVSLRASESEQQRGVALLEEILTSYPEHRAALRAGRALFKIKHLRIGSVAAEIEAVDVDGEELRLSDSRGKVVLLLFWGMWAKTCVSQLPSYVNLVRTFPESDFEIIGIATDTNKAKFKKDCQRRGVTWRNAWEGSDKGPIATRWMVNAFPKAFIIDRKGVIRYTNPMSSQLVPLVSELVAEK